MFWRWAKIQTWQLHTSKCIMFTNKQQLNIKHQMQWQGGVHNPVMPREKAVGESFRERVVEVALEQWPQQHTAPHNTAFAAMPSRHQRQFHVTGTQYISTDKVQSQTLNTGGTAEIFSPWAISPGRFLLYSELWELLYSVLSRISAAPFCPCISQYTAQKFICLVCICRSRVDLSAWKSALFRKISLSERSEFEIFLNAFSRFSDT